MKITEAAANIGRSVTYTPFEGCDSDQLEFGIITEVRHSNVFVRYGSELQSKATNPEDLKFEGTATETIFYGDNEKIRVVTSKED